MSVDQLPSDISSYWYDKHYDNTSGRNVAPDQRFFRFLVQDAASYTHLANSHLVVTFRVQSAVANPQTTWIGSVLQMIDRCSLHLDGNTVEYHNYVTQNGIIDPLYWSQEYLKQNGSLAGIDLFDCENDWGGIWRIDATGTGQYNYGGATPLPEVVTDDANAAGNTTLTARPFNNTHTPEGRRLQRSTARGGPNAGFSTGKWITLRLPLRNLYRFANAYNGILSGVQADLKIWFHQNNAQLLCDSTPGTVVTPASALEFQTVYLDVARLTVPKPLSLNNHIGVVIPNQWEVYRNQIPASTSTSNSVFVLNSVDKVTRLTFYFVEPENDIGSSFMNSEKNYLQNVGLIDNFKCYINDRLIPKMDLDFPYYDSVTNSGGTFNLYPPDVYQDTNMAYIQYLKRAGNLLPNREFESNAASGNYQASGALDTETFRTRYFHITINAIEREYADPMFNLTVNFNCNFQAAGPGTAKSTPAMTMYTIVEKIQEVDINVKGTNASVGVIG